MALFTAYYAIARELFSKNLINEEDISGKRILVVGDNNVEWMKGATACEVIRNYLLEHGAKECVVYGLLNGYRISAERLAAKEFLYGDFGNIAEKLQDREPFDTVIVMEGMERVESFRKAASDVKALSVGGGTVYLLARTPANITGGPEALLVWYEDLWRYEKSTMGALFQEDEPDILPFGYGKTCQWLLTRFKNMSPPENIFSRQVPMYSCQAYRRIYEHERRTLGYFKAHALEDLGRREVTDKSYYIHNYLNKYEHFLDKFRDERFTLLELGVFEGASERMWRDYFQQAEIVGVDIDARCKQYEGDRIRIEIADLGEYENLKRLRDFRPTIIVDDASHLWSHQIKALFTLYDVLPSGGVYIIEDMETAANPEQYPGFNDCKVDSYTVCERLMRVVMSKTPCKEEPFAAEITRIGLMTELAAVMKGSCILIRK